MNDMSTTLPMAIPGREYIIQSIKKGTAMADTFKGYGIFPGARITLLFNSPAQNPSAYEVMGAVLALRKEDSNGICISPVADAAAK